MQGKAIYIRKCGALWERLLHLWCNRCSFEKTNVPELGAYQGKIFLSISLSLHVSVFLCVSVLLSLLGLCAQQTDKAIFRKKRDKGTGWASESPWREHGENEWKHWGKIRDWWFPLKLELEERQAELCFAVQLSCFCLMLKLNSIKKMKDFLADGS